MKALPIIDKPRTRLSALILAHHVSENEGKIITRHTLTACRRVKAACIKFGLPVPEAIEKIAR